MADFKKYLPLLKQVEGGYQNLEKDGGNYNSLGQRVGTNHGISARFYEGIIRRPPTVDDMKNLSLERARSLFKVYFWDDIHGDSLINQSVAELICDHAINGGEGAIAPIVQKILNYNFGFKLKVDGDIGTTTAKAINAVNQSQLYALIKEGRKKHYLAIGGSFLPTWLDRLTKFSFTPEEKKK